jgi:hypothetical protein
VSEKCLGLTGSTIIEESVAAGGGGLILHPVCEAMKKMTKMTDAGTVIFFSYVGPFV